MPQGCDFTCDNKDCPNFGKTIVMHGIWPTKPIEKAMAESDDERRKALEMRMKEGRKTALFVYPQDKEESPSGYRLQLYCPSCLIMEDVDFDENQEAKTMADDPSVCGKCGGTRFSLKKAIEQSLKCPACNVAMKQFYWFTK